MKKPRHVPGGGAEVESVNVRGQLGGRVINYHVFAHRRTSNPRMGERRGSHRDYRATRHRVTRRSDLRYAEGRSLDASHMIAAFETKVRAVLRGPC